MNLPYDVVYKSNKYYIQTWQYSANEHYPWQIVYLCYDSFPVKDHRECALTFDTPDDAYAFMKAHKLG